MHEALLFRRLEALQNALAYYRLPMPYTIKAHNEKPISVYNR